MKFERYSAIRYSVIPSALLVTGTHLTRNTFSTLASSVSVFFLFSFFEFVYYLITFYSRYELSFAAYLSVLNPFSNL